jgi:hypothetical protein
VNGPVMAWNSDFSNETGSYWYETGMLGLSAGFMYEIEGSEQGAFGICSDDFDGDGDADIAVVTSSTLSWWENLDGIGTTWAVHTVDNDYTGAYGLCACDIDGDGDVDLVDSSPTTVTWWENTNGLGTAWNSVLIDGNTNGTSCLIIDDVNDDGNPDVLAAAMAGNTIAWWDNSNGLGTLWIEHIVDGDFYAARGVFCDDMDQDGDRDILGAALGANTITWWENTDGLGDTWVEHAVDTDVDTPWGICSIDIENDGDRDILATSFNGWSIFCWENTDGFGTTWVKHLVDGNLFGPSSVLAADLDGDGLEDVLGTVYYGSMVAWWKTREGSPDDWHREVLSQVMSGAYDIAINDIDNDGYADVLAASSFDVIAWWNMQEYLSPGALVSSILYLGCDPDWGSITWSGLTPAGTALSFQVRASDSYTQMGAWSGTLTSPCSLDGILTDSSSYLQYRTILSTADPDSTPILNDVMITWDPMGTGEGEDPQLMALLPFSPNPSPSPVVRFSLPEPSSVWISVFDLTGRLVSEIHETEYATGYHDAMLGDLSPGIYFCLMTSGEFAAARRFVVVE